MCNCQMPSWGKKEVVCGDWSPSDVNQTNPLHLWVHDIVVIITIQFSVRCTSLSLSYTLLSFLFTLLLSTHVLSSSYLGLFLYLFLLTCLFLKLIFTFFLFFSIFSPGPLPTTVGDFWRMIWESRVINVVMLTGVVEAGKVKKTRALSCFSHA